jgi:subtilisin family serine protease
MPVRALSLAALCALMAACAPLPPADDASTAAAEGSERQILVMLRAAPPHYRPDADYAPAYGARATGSGERRIAEDIAQRYALKLVTAWPMPALGLDCFVLEAANAELVAGLVERVGQDTRVEWAQTMNRFHVLGSTDPLFALQPGAQLWHLAEVHRITTGRDVRIAEIDTGVELDHPDLRGRIALARDFAGAPPVNGEAHGTAVAGIIAARADDGIGIAGVAPDSRLLALRACGQTPGSPVATCTSFALAKALQFALDRDARIINLSLGGPPDRLIARLIDASLERHAIVVGAVDPQAADGGFPASHPGVLAVAADGDPNAPAGALVAPGTDVPATMPGRTWAFVTGSSYAAAQVSGAAALMLERAPTLDAAAMRSALMPIAVAHAGPGPPARVDICAALARTTNACVCGCTVVARSAHPLPSR